MNKTSCQATLFLKVICKLNVRNVGASWLAPKFVSTGCGTGKSINYCQRRYLNSNKRQLHTAVILNEREKTEQRVKVPGEKDLSPSNLENSATQVKQKGKPQTEAKVIERLKPPKPVEDKQESSLPNHDPERITDESRRLERKANSIFQELSETRGATKETFILAVKKFADREGIYWRGAVEFIYAGMKEMQTFGVVKDLDAYKALIQAFPEGKMIPRNAWQVEFMHYPRHQQCGIDMLEQMEHNGVIPDEAFGVLLKNRFGREAHVTRKYRRMLYWLPKFKNINPYPIPMELPVDPRQLALIALRRMSVDRETQYTIHETTELEAEPEEETFIASAQSPTQQRLIQEHNMEQPLFVEGPYPVYLREVRQNYFLLRAEPNINALMKKKQLEKEEEADENLFEWTNFFEDEKSSELRPLLSVHEQDDSTILALAITGTSTKSSVVSWVRCLETINPRLSQTPVLFKIMSSSDSASLDVIGDNRPFWELQKNTEKISDI
ncbi:evolutionarily conserved signaling intermediate in toll pathway, mitochondrial [Plakobranchus ocellatus]|uniref:Evolutionarily conserved signaling intermediate in Toll pathway, mitochondrial n=1 Tax=Plakobranchus ocellatus TaxID=259542 RepID=A0AAV3Y859_9GAST|nr:evolutionarily conserved signaling intermediate in toll pathway, mitochondrial [Plakobranchus ocellatus]